MVLPPWMQPPAPMDIDNGEERMFPLPPDPPALDRVHRRLRNNGLIPHFGRRVAAAAPLPPPPPLLPRVEHDPLLDGLPNVPPQLRRQNAQV